MFVEHVSGLTYCALRVVWVELLADLASVSESLANLLGYLTCEQALPLLFRQAMTENLVR